MITKFQFHNYDTLLHGEGKFDPRKTVGKGEAEQVVVLLFAAKNGDIRAIRRWYMQHASLGMSDYDGRTALHLAASEGHTELVKFLLNVAKVQHDPKDRWLRTPLDDAITFGRDECAQILEKARLLAIPPLMRNNYQKKSPVSAQTKKIRLRNTVICERSFDEEDENLSENPETSDESDFDDGRPEVVLQNNQLANRNSKSRAYSDDAESELSDEDIEENDESETAESKIMEAVKGAGGSSDTCLKKLSVTQEMEFGSESESFDEDFEQELERQKKRSLSLTGDQEYDKLKSAIGEMSEGEEDDEELMRIASPPNPANLYPKEEMLTMAACKSAESVIRDASESVFSQLSTLSPDMEPSDLQAVPIKEIVSTLSEIILDASKLARFSTSANHN
uniref:Uncharacterized protein n=1 Tax=Plectus sambesii TaxID=2011161 RepID=A0A914WTN1_9BILA